MKQTGYFITFEGLDGCGKSTQAKLLADALEREGFKVLRTREPGGSLFSEHLRKIILDPNHRVSPITELLLYEASRASHTDEVIRPALEKNFVVICERYSDATIAYQGFGRGLPLKKIKFIDRFATGGLKPHLTIFLEIPVERSLARIRRKKDRLEMENKSFYMRVLQGYRKIRKQQKKRFVVVKGTGNIKKIHERVLSAVKKCLKI
ncbi:MAG: dTMP kinase [Elusimicrobia bacterium]|nr:dTMP kinase [Elusimicrobiota bacterium]